MKLSTDGAISMLGFLGESLLGAEAKKYFESARKRALLGLCWVAIFITLTLVYVDPPTTYIRQILVAFNLLLPVWGLSVELKRMSPRRIFILLLLSTQFLTLIILACDESLSLLAYPMLVFPLFSVMALLLCGGLSAFLFGLAALVWIVIYGHLQISSTYNFILLGNLVLVTVTLMFLGLETWSSFLRMNRALELGSESLAALVQEQKALIQTLFFKIEIPISQLEQALIDSNVGRLMTSVERLKLFVVGEDSHKVSLQQGFLLNFTAEKFRLKVARWLLVGTFLVQGTIALRNVSFSAEFGLPHIMASLLVTIAGLLILERWPGTRGWIVAVVFLVFFANHINNCRLWGFSSFAPPLILEPLFPFMAVLIFGGPFAAIITTVSIALLLWAYFKLPAGEVFDLARMQIFVVVTVLVCFSALNNIFENLMLEQELKTKGLENAWALKRKLSATLYHDVKNHLTALSVTVEMVNELGLTPSLREKLTVYSQRLIDFLVASKEHLAGEKLAIGSEPKPVKVKDVFDILVDLFEVQLSAKNLSLIVTTEDDLICLAQEDILVGSVLGNLMSNAIKFTPRGKVLQLSARRLGDKIEMRLQDGGPGLAASVLLTLAKGHSLRSAPGSEGELGLGLGLNLALEYVEQLKGRLSFETGSQGGLEVVLTLAAA